MSVNAATPQKFIFDLDLGQANQKTTVIGEHELDQLLKQAETRGYEKGVHDGENTAANKAATALSNAAQKLANNTAKIAKSSDDLQSQALQQITELSVVVGKKLAANLIARAPLGEIKALISECLHSLENAPHLVIRCHPELADAVEELTKSQMRSSGFAGRLVIMGDPEILLGDARMEWVDGGLIRDLSQMSEEIDTRVKVFISANCRHSESMNTPPNNPSKFGTIQPGTDLSATNNQIATHNNPVSKIENENE